MNVFKSSKDLFTNRRYICIAETNVYYSTTEANS
jgi:hypothetical protein